MNKTQKSSRRIFSDRKDAFVGRNLWMHRSFKITFQFDSNFYGQFHNKLACLQPNK